MYRNITNSTQVPSAPQAEPDDLSTRGAPSSSSYFPSSIVVGPVTGSTWPEGNRLLLFCDIVLKHTDYPHAFRNQNQNSEEEEESSEEKSAILTKNESRISTSPLNSVGESAMDSMRSGSSITGSEGAELEPEEYDKEAYESVSCWCGQPYAGRAMIECDRCLTWFHMTCEQVREGHVPELFHCKRCKSKKRRHRPSTSSTRRGSKKKRRSSASTSATVASSSSSAANSAEPSPPHLQLEHAGSEELPSPLRLEEESTNHSPGYNQPLNGDFAAIMAEPLTSDRYSGMSENSVSLRTAKKKGKKRSASNVNGLTASTLPSASIVSSQPGLNAVYVGESGQSVPSTSASQPPPLLPCYIGLVAATPEIQRLQNGHMNDHNTTMNGNISSHSFTSIPVLEPQIVDCSQRRPSFDLKKSYTSSGIFPSDERGLNNNV